MCVCEGKEKGGRYTRIERKKQTKEQEHYTFRISGEEKGFFKVL